MGYPPAGVVRGAVPVPTALGANPVAATPASTAATSSADGSAGQGYSTTNDQEAGVDEPDMVKTDGQVMVVLRQDPLGVQVVDVSGSAPKLEGFLALPQLQQASGLFLVGQDVYVIGGGTSGPLPVRYVSGPQPTAQARSAKGAATVVPGGPMISTPLMPWGGSSSTTEVVVVSVAPGEPGHREDVLIPGPGARRTANQRPGGTGSDEPASLVLGVPPQLNPGGRESGDGG